MTNLVTPDPRGAIVGRTVQVVAGLTAVAIILPVLLYAYGLSMTTLEQIFSFAALTILAKTLLAVAMLIMVFFARPRSKYLRVTIAILSGMVLAYAVYGAVVQELALGDALIYLIGSFIGLTETLEANLPRRTIQPAGNLHQTPTVKP